MVLLVGFEPTSSSHLEASPRYKLGALPLSYRSKTGLTGRNRTCDPQLRRLLFYPLNYGQIGAAKENRTLNFCLEGSGFTIKLQPHKTGAPGEIRTPDLPLTRRLLWPTELLGQIWLRILGSNQGPND